MNMKMLIALLLIFCHTQYVTSLPIFEVVVTKLKEFGNTIMEMIHTITNKVKDMLNIRDMSEKANTPPVHWRHVIEEKTRRFFNDIVEESTQDSSTEIAELNNLKTEPTALMTTPQLAKYHGKRIESHVVITGDGYLLTVHRLVTAQTLNRSVEENLTNPTVLLHHGLLGSSADWILLGREKSLPYILSNLGYDVWMANARGNCYSLGHVSLEVDSLKYWKFSWQEIGRYDLPAVVDYIRKLKNTKDPIDFIGHSMGATALLVLLSTAPRYNQYFRIGILLAPLAYMTNTEGPFRIFTPMAMNLPDEMLNILGAGEFLPTRRIPTWIVKKYCKGALLYCSNPLLFLSGTIQNSLDSDLLARILHHVPAGGSTNTILHYAQLVRTGKFQKFEENTEFPLKKVTLPIALFTSSDDWLATIPDVLKLYISIANPIDHYVIRGKNLSHTEFVFGPHANDLVYNKVVKLLRQSLVVHSAKVNEV